MALAALTVPAGAFWEISESKDRLTDKIARAAFSLAKKADSGVEARLDLTCVPGYGANLSMWFSRPLARFEISYRWRVDEGQATNRFGRMNRNFNEILVFARPDQLSGARRLRVEVFPPGRAALFYEFDISGFSEARRKIGC